MGEPARCARVQATRILVVDDSHAVRRALSALLEDAGYDVETAESGEAAYQRCLAAPYDLVVTDLTMGALSGVQLCRLLRSDEATAETHIVMLTAADDPRSRFWGRKAGADAYLGKETMVGDLLPTVARLLEDASEHARSGTGTYRIRSRGGPLERLSQVLDQHLFDAVVQSEVRSLMDEIHSRRGFATAVCRLASTISEYGYLALHLEGPAGPTCTIHARGPFPAEVDADVLAWLGITDVGDVEVLREGPLSEGRVASGEMAWFPIEAAGERLGSLQVFGGTKRLSGEDHRTLELCAREVALPVKTLFLVEQTNHLAHTDGLTGLPNRRRCTEQLQHEVARAQRQGTPLTVAVCDIDLFKQVNDQHGHNVGDQVLARVGESLARSVRNIDMVGRWGGEEFLALLPNAQAAGGRVVAERMRQRVAVCVGSMEGIERVTISVGLASYEPGESAEQLVGRADEALYRAKHRGRNRVELAAEAAVVEPEPELS